jgi:processive 1,2-diacylglycerol beta-glucosyltransferase
LKKSERTKDEGTRPGPVLILTISNGAGHTRAAEAIAEAIHSRVRGQKALVVDVADYMTPIARFTHVTAYLWLVKYAPAVWDRMDKYQKKQPHTSPEWYYRRGARRLFELARELRPSAIISTEVGCSEIAALIKRDLQTEATPLVAVNVNYDADRAWVQSEVNLYCVVTEQVKDELITHGAPPERIRVWGVPMEPGFTAHALREEERVEVCRWLGLDSQLPLILVAGGSCGMGRVEEITGRLMRLQRPVPQLVVLTGRNLHLHSRLQRMIRKDTGQRLRIIGWTPHVAKLMRAADLMVSKLGNTFDEAMAAGLPIISLEPPPGSEQVQYGLLNKWGVGRGLRTVDEVTVTVSELLEHKERLAAMRAEALGRSQTNAARLIANWISEHLQAGEDSPFSYHSLPVAACRQTLLKEI